MVTVADTQQRRPDRTGATTSIPHPPTGSPAAILPPTAQDHLTADQRFWRFHDQHPMVYRLLVQLTREFLRRTGKRRVSIAMAWERARWEYELETGEAPKLDNSLKAYYARLIMAQEIDLRDVYETRRSAADEMIADPPPLPEGALF